MPRLPRSEWYDLTRDMNWDLSYVTEERGLPEPTVQQLRRPDRDWWTWDEPYKITYPEYVHNQAGKDAGVYSVNNVVNRSEHLRQPRPGLAGRGHRALRRDRRARSTRPASARRAWRRFGRAAAWRNMATFGTLDETRHGQLQTYFPLPGAGQGAAARLGAQGVPHQRVGHHRRAAPLRRHVHRERRGVDGASS